jgi:hypothetical protein
MKQTPKQSNRGNTLAMPQPNREQNPEAKMTMTRFLSPHFVDAHYIGLWAIA